MPPSADPLPDAAWRPEPKAKPAANHDLESDDEEGMDNKAKALMHLLKTSGVFVAIMADKMREQQEQQRREAEKEEEARKKMAAEQTNGQKEEKTKTTSSVRTRGGKQDGENVAPVKTEEDEEKKKHIPTRGRGKATKLTTKTSSSQNIASYFQQADVQVEGDNKKSVQQALAQAADEFESKPTTLGEQSLKATQQPSLVTGGKMREYQLEGLEWLKSLWMNGLCGILADEMGLGKTVQAISMLAFFKEQNISGPFLIAAPLSTLSNWIDEFARWTPDIETVLYHGSKDERAALRRKRMGMKDQKKAEFPVVCTSYEICMNDRKFLAQYQWKYIIVDEGHRLKNMNCKLIKELMTYNSANRLLITGTPLQNNISELWSLLHFLLPEVFNDVDSFENSFDFSEVLETEGQAGVAEKRKRNLVSTMHAILKPFLLRRIKTDVETSLPKKREYILYAPLTAEQKELYREILAGSSRQYLEEKAVERIDSRNGSTRTTRLKRKSDSGVSTPNKSVKSSRASTPASGTMSARRRKGMQSYKDITDREFNKKLRKLEMGEEEEEESEEEVDESEQEEIERAKTIKLAKQEISGKKLQNPIMQARLACNSPHNFYWPFDEKHPIDKTLTTASGKLLLLESLLPYLFKLGHKCLIFSQFKTTLDILQDWAEILHDWNCCRIDGGVAQTDRRDQIHAFNNDPSYKLFLLSTRAGGQGINLTAADTVILFDSDWNPQQDLQAMDRAHRIGQTRPVIVYRLATRGTVEQTLLEKADSKRRLEKLVIQKGKFKSLLDTKSKDDVVDELRSALDDADFERVDVGDGAGGKAILSQKDLDVLTDRSDEAYVRAEKGLEGASSGEGTLLFKAVETKREGEGGLMDGFTTKK